MNKILRQELASTTTTSSGRNEYINSNNNNNNSIKNRCISLRKRITEISFALIIMLAIVKCLDYDIETVLSRAFSLFTNVTREKKQQGVKYHHKIDGRESEMFLLNELKTEIKKKYTHVYKPKTLLQVQKNITTIALIGERNSGTTWLYHQLRQCFSNTSLQVNNHLTRHKHYFQIDSQQIQNQTFVISQWRHPYQWILAMMSKSRHTPAHRDMDWKTFVTTPWTMPRAESDASYINTTHACKQGFSYHQVVCCNEFPAKNEYLIQKRNGNVEQETPFYELRQDNSGIPYESIIELRKDKILNMVYHVKTFSFVHDVFVTRYEDLLEYGLDYVMDAVEQVTGVQKVCKEVDGPQDKSNHERRVDLEFKDWMDNYIHWDTEKNIGYFPS